MTVRDIIWIPDRRVTGREIIAQVADRRGLTVEEMLAGRKRKLAHPRQEAMWEMRQRTSLSFPQIARLMGLQDHTTIVHGVKAHARRLSQAQWLEAAE